MLYNSKRRSGVLRAKTKGSERFVYLPAANGPVVQLVRTLACHARGRRFEPVPGRHYAAMAQSVERVLGKDVTLPEFSRKETSQFNRLL